MIHVRTSRKEIVRTNASSQKDNDSAFQRSSILSTIVRNTRGKLRVWKLKFVSFQMGSVYTDAVEKNAQRCRKHKFCNLDKVVNPCFGCHLVTACGPRS